MRKIAHCFSILWVISSIGSSAAAQTKVAFSGGFHSSYVYEYTDKPAWNSEYRPFYNPRPAFHGGLIFDIPFTSQSDWFFQPAITYSGKGRKFKRDTYYGIDYALKSEQFINYLDIPLNIVYKADISNPIHKSRTKFIIGFGPYLAYVLGGTESVDTVFSNGTQVHKSNQLNYGSGPGQYGRFDFGISGQLGLQFGRVFITANISRGLLTSFYHAVGYDATYRNGVIGGTIGIYLGKNKENIVHDQDKDGVPDEADECPTEPGTALTKGCPDTDGDGIPDKTDKCPEVAGSVKNEGCPVADSDGDGVEDDKDKCPNAPGLPIYDGCPFPDRDGDGVSDFDDRCPDSTGPAINKGCPVGDRDKDGINDLEDKCPDVAGIAKYKGCPIPDTDSDGVNDEEDKCPKTKGLKENAGCPVMNKEMTDKLLSLEQRIQFTGKKSDIPDPTYKVLDEVIDLLKQNPTLTLAIESYTSNEGDSSANLKLTVERANNIMAYIGLQGIDWSRLKAVGHGAGIPSGATGKQPTETVAGDRIKLIPGYQ